MTPSHVFVSHSDKNRQQVDALVAELEAHNVRVWVAPRDVRPGNYMKDTEQAIADCAAFIIVVTEEANGSDFVQSETGLAFSLRRPIFPVRLAGIKPARGLGLALSVRHWTDAFGPDRTKNVERLSLELAPVAPRSGAPSPPADYGVDIVLTQASADKVRLIKAVRDIGQGSLAAARALVWGTPSVIAEGLSRTEAGPIMLRLQFAGGDVRLVPRSTPAPRGPSPISRPPA